MIKSGKSIGIILPGTETRQIKYERDALAIFESYAKTLKNLDKQVPKHIKITIEILSWAEPMYYVFHPRGG